MNRIEQTLRDIEEMEHEWYIDLNEEQAAHHSYGRIPSDGRRVGLWSIPRSTGEFLQFMLGLTRSRTVLELGCSAGYSTIYLARQARENGGHVYTIELLQQKAVLAKKHFQQAGLDDTITLIENEIITVLDQWKGPQIEYVFMDADKENYGTYMNMIIPLMNSGGLVIADNAAYTAAQDGSKQSCNLLDPFIDQIRKDARLESMLLNVDNGLVLAYKK